MRVAIIDDHPMFRQGVARTLVEYGFQVVAEGASATDAVTVAAKHCPDVMLLDISLPGNGLDAISVILDRAPSVRIVMLTASESGQDVRKALRLGASGYILKGIGSQGLIEALHSVKSGECYVPASLTVRLITEDPRHARDDSTKAPLSTREKDVMELIAVGLSNKEVARKLGIHEKTVKHHMTHIMDKLDVTNRTEAAVKWHGTVLQTMQGRLADPLDM